MKKKTLRSFEQLHKVLDGLYGYHYIFRGVKSQDYKLVPKIARIPHTDPQTRLEREQRMLSEFQNRAQPHLRHIPRSDWEWLALAQHHGMMTRLLDWTRNPLVAAFFAVEEEFSGDSAIYCFKTEKHIELQKYSEPFAYPGVGVFSSIHLTPRITAQSGLFTISSDPTVSIDSPDLLKLIIPNALRKKFKKRLFQYGVHHGSVFPDLDGIARLCSWQFSNIY